LSGQFLQLTIEAPIGKGAATRFNAMDCEQAVVASHCPAEEALAIAGAGLAALEVAGLGGGPDAVALLVALAEIEEALGRFGDAAVTIAAAIAILEDILPECGDDDIVMLWCQAQERLAGLERLAGDFDVAAARLRAVLEAALSAFGEASMAVVSAANALGVVCKYASDFDAAEVAYRRAVAALDGLADPEPLIRAGLLHNLGGLAHSRGDAAGGIPLAERGAALRAEGLGADHPDVARDLNALGALYHLAGRTGDAAQAYRRALAVFEDRYGPDHFEVAMTCANLAVLAGDQGHYGEAESLGRRSLRILQAILGPLDAEVGLTLLNLAAVIANQGRRVEAAALTTRAAAILTARLPRDHPHVVAAGEALERVGRAS